MRASLRGGACVRGQRRADTWVDDGEDHLRNAAPMAKPASNVGSSPNAAKTANRAM